MKYTHIAAALGWTETPDNQDGLFLQPEEAASIDAAIGANATAAADLVTANETIATLNSEVTRLTDAATAAETTTQTLNDRITALESENKELGKKPSGSGTVITTKEDPKAGEDKTPSYLDDNDPANAWLDRKMKRNKS